MDLLKQMRERREAIDARLKEITDAQESESRAASDEENVEIDGLLEERGKVTARIEELAEQELREARAAKADIELNGINEVIARVSPAQVNSEPNPVYRRDNMLENSFFRDLFVSKERGDRDAMDRLVRSQETRAGDLNTGAGTGGQFAPPLWLVDDFVKLARPGRPTADLMQQEVLPKGVSSINLPTVTGGTATGVQTTQNTAVTDTALTTGSVSTGITTIAGQQTVSLQLIDQSGIPFDRVVLGDLTADYAKQIDNLVLTDLSAISGIISVTDSNATITVAEVYGDVANAINQIATNRFLPPDAIVMSPARWYWLVSQVDSSGRPLVVPTGPAFNQIASTGAPQAEGAVGEMLGLPVYLDAQMPISGTSPAPANAIYVLRRADNWLFESALNAMSFDATYANQLTVLFRVHGYAGFINRYPKAVAQIGGAGYSPAPVFA